MFDFFTRASWSQAISIWDILHPSLEDVDAVDACHFEHKVHPRATWPTFGRSSFALTTRAAFLPQAFRAPGLRRCLLGARSCAAHAQSDCQQNVWLLVEPLGSVGTTVLIRRFEEFRIP